MLCFNMLYTFSTIHGNYNTGKYAMTSLEYAKKKENGINILLRNEHFDVSFLS